jgi:hypothetical protein
MACIVNLLSLGIAVTKMRCEATTTLLSVWACQKYPPPEWLWLVGRRDNLTTAT